MEIGISGRKDCYYSINKIYHIKMIRYKKVVNIQ